MPPILYPLVNGLRYDYSSVDILLGVLRFSGIKSITYKHSLEPGELRGSRAQLVGRTRGKYSAEGSVELYRLEYEALISQLALLGLPLSMGYLEVAFDIQVAHQVTLVDPAPIVDKLIGCRIKSADRTNTEGEEPLTVKCDLHIMYIQEGGKDPLGIGQMLK
jgi:hypothetical protein